ncbi:hypothetical protein Tsubulata_005925 [Turnera subulata]|uniref:Homer protein n=1 Tax=Turnera subulata TaxID=218843 RepID=A0A9Q0JKT4_9ROSI|nr:hypothetical protein Tsubulata_005925 [Turnera subulata]
MELATTTTTHCSLISPSSPNPKSRLAEHYCITKPTCFGVFYRANTSLARPLLVKCSSSSNNSPEDKSLKDGLAGMVGKGVEELLNKEENKVLLDGLEKAAQRVEMARQELAEIERQELEAKQYRELEAEQYQNHVNQLQARVSEAAQSQREIAEARAMLEEAERSLTLSLSGNIVGDGDAPGSEGVDKKMERLESIKAASISAIVGTLAGLPVSLAQLTSSNDQLLLPTVITFISCLLFGVTFRYAVRRDIDNIQLKTGTAAAFAFVKGLGALGGGPPLELNPESFLSHAFGGATLVSQNLLIFFFAAVSLDFCFKTELLSPFPMKRSASTTNKE